MRKFLLAVCTKDLTKRKSWPKVGKDLEPKLQLEGESKFQSGPQ